MIRRKRMLEIEEVVKPKPQIKIVLRNMRVFKCSEGLPEYHVRCDRGHSPLACPYPIGELTREAVIVRYRKWFRAQLASKNPEVINELVRLQSIAERHGKLYLYCWCAPLPCHVHTIMAHLKRMLKI